jgi:hypothetical protein
MNKEDNIIILQVGEINKDEFVTKIKKAEVILK